MQSPTREERPGNFWHEDNMEEGKIDFAQKFHRTDRDRQENDSPERAAKSLACPDGRIITMSPFLAEERSDDDDTILCRLPVTMMAAKRWRRDCPTLSYDVQKLPIHELASISAKQVLTTFNKIRFA